MSYHTEEGKISGAQRVKINSPNFGKFNPILFFILLFFSTLAFTVAVDPLVSWMDVPDWHEGLLQEILKILEGNMVYAYISLAILPALLEEWFNRGIISRGLLKHLSPTKAILWSAFIFAALHLNLWQEIPCFVSGCFLGWIYYKTRSIWAVIFIHFTNNGYANFSDYASPEIPIGYSLADIIPDKATYWLLVSVSIGVISLTIFLIDKYIKKTKINPPQ